MTSPRLELYVVPGSSTHDLASLDPQSLVAASYLQLLRPGDWDLVPCTDPSLSPSGLLPFLKHGPETYTGSAILAYLVQTASSAPSRSLYRDEKSDADARAFKALLDTTLLPLVLHSLYSLPENWLTVRSLLLPSFPFPSNFYRPNQLRHAAHELVDATHPLWWGLGGEAEKEEELQRRRKRALLETGTEGVRERKEEERREVKERVRKTFGEGKIVSAARNVFTALETTLASSSTPFFFSSSSPTPLDAHLSALLSLALYLPLPQPLLADLINASFPRLWAHSALLRRTLWGGSGSGGASPPSVRSPSSTSLTASLARALDPRALLAAPLARGGRPVSPRAPLSAKERDFARKRWAFFAVCAVGVVGWGVGTGAVPLPFGGRWGRLAVGEGEWEEEDGEEEEEDDDDLE
ncbi:hypothetical protein JCM10207_001760 [Rhodosporidiobolus poonsookiae]